MIPRNQFIEKDESKPLARHFQSRELAHAYILGLEDAKRALGAHRIFPEMDPWVTLNTMWMEVKESHKLGPDVPEPPDLGYSKNKRRG